MMYEAKNMRVSIITVCFNSDATIANTISSIARQNYDDIEHIIIDGGSTDSTMQIIRSSSSVTLYVSEPDKGIYDAMNKGIALATGDVIGILNSDDFFESDDVIAQVVKQFESQTDVDLVFGDVVFVRPDNLNKIERYYSSWSFKPWKLRFGFMPAHPATFIKKSVYDAVGLYKLDYIIAADFDMFVRMLLIHKVPFSKIRSPLVRMRMGGVSTAGLKSNWISSKEMVRAFSENGLYTNLLFVLLRLPLKLFQLIMHK